MALAMIQGMFMNEIGCGALVRQGLKSFDMPAAVRLLAAARTSGSTLKFGPMKPPSVLGAYYRGLNN